MLRAFAILIPSLLIVAEAHAQSFDIHSETPKSLGRGGATVANADDSSLYFSNPAGLGRFVETRTLEASGLFLRKPRDYTVKASLTDGKTEDPLVWGFSFNGVRTRDREYQDYRVATGIDLYDQSLFIGATTRFTNFNTATLTPDKSVFAGNLGLLGFIGDYVSLGISADNLLRSQKKTSVAPVLVRAGGSLNLQWARLSGEAERNFSSKVWEFKGGLEWRPTYYLTFRGGGRMQKARSTNIDAGYSLGFSLASANDRVGLDAGFFDELKSDFVAWSVGISLRF